MEKSANQAKRTFQHGSSKNASIVEKESNQTFANMPIPASLIDWFNQIENGGQGAANQLASEME